VQDAINALAKQGGSKPKLLYIKKGVYYENLIIPKTLVRPHDPGI